MTGTPLGATPEKPSDKQLGDRTEKTLDSREDARQERQDDREARLVLAQAQEILRDHGNMESNIPLTNDYWRLMGRFRYLSRPTP